MRRWVFRWPLLATLAIVFGVSCDAHAQIGLCAVSDVQLQRVTTADLDTMYLSVFDRDFEMAGVQDSTVTRDIAAVRAWTNFVDELSTYLDLKGWRWGTPTRIFCRVYFSRSGTMEYVLTDVKTSTFDRITPLCMTLREFAKSYRFPLQGTRAFSHCGMVTFRDKSMGARRMD